MNLYWVMVHSLHVKFPFPDEKSAMRFYELARIYCPHEVDFITPYY